MTGNTSNADKQNEWLRVGQRMWSLTVGPFEHLPFVGYSFLVVLFGGLGMWTEVYKHFVGQTEPSLAGLLTSVLTYFPAMAGPAAIQISASAFGKNDRSMMMVGFVFLCIFSATAVWLALVGKAAPLAVLLWGVAVALGAFWVWWIANGEDPNFMNSPPPDAASGGDTRQALPGTLKGFNS